MHHIGNIEITEIRPRFRLRTDLSKDYIKNLFSKRFETDKSIRGKIVGDHVHIKIPNKDVHFWSPELGIDLDFRKEKNLLRCLVGPKQQVWAMFLFIYGAIILLGMFGGIYGITQWQLGQETNWLWTFPIAIVLFAGAFIAAKIGQKIGHEQMVHLIKTLHSILGKEHFQEESY